MPINPFSLLNGARKTFYNVPVLVEFVFLIGASGFAGSVNFSTGLTDFQEKLHLKRFKSLPLYSFVNFKVVTFFFT